MVQIMSDKNVTWSKKCPTEGIGGRQGGKEGRNGRLVGKAEQDIIFVSSQQI